MFSKCSCSLMSAHPARPSPRVPFITEISITTSPFWPLAVEDLCPCQTPPPAPSQSHWGEVASSALVNPPHQRVGAKSGPQQLAVYHGCIQPAAFLLKAAVFYQITHCIYSLKFILYVKSIARFSELKRTAAPRLSPSISRSDFSICSSPTIRYHGSR